MSKPPSDDLPPSGKEQSPISIIRELQSGTLRATSLSSASRRACIDHLHVEGYNASEIAEIFKISVRTVRRDLAAIRDDHAVLAEPKFVARTVGQLVQEAESAMARLRRIARDRECPHAAKVDAERSAWTVMREFVEKLQSLGYLPTAAQQIRADLTHRLEGDRISQEFLEVETVLAGVALPPESSAAKQIRSLKERRGLPSSSANASQAQEDGDPSHVESGHD